MKRWPIYAVCLFLTVQLTVNTAPAQPENGKQQPAADTNNLLQAFKKGRISGHLRYFFMATGNAYQLSDYHAHAVGGGLKFETAPVKGFRFGVSGFFVFNIGSSDFTVPDPQTNQQNRYELGLFDLEKPGNKSDLGRLEELYIKYNWKKSQITFGRQRLNTPFLNPQDGRMGPNSAGGLYGEFNELKNTKIEGGFLYEMLPRSIMHWVSIGESVGRYPQGVTPQGTRSNYGGALSGKGIGLLEVTRQFGKTVSVKVHELFVHNIFNTVLLQADFTRHSGKPQKLQTSVQLIRQDAVNDGGNPVPAKTYFTKGGHAFTFGGKIGWAGEHWQTSLNYNRITKAGRYLLPREWGRDPFFTFLPRERNEGFGDVHAGVWKIDYAIPAWRLKTQLALGYFRLPDVNNYALNKYGMPSYTQLNLDLRYRFAGWLKGLESELLFVYKQRRGETYGNDKYVINKVNMNQWNLMVNYRF